MDPDYQYESRKPRRVNKKKKQDQYEQVNIKQDPDSQMIRYVEQLEKELLRKNKILELNRKKYQTILESFSKVIDNKGIEADKVKDYIQSTYNSQ